MLVSSCDVLVDSFRPGVLARLGLDPRQLMEEHPRLIYCAVTGFGLTGPDALLAGHDIGYNARAGVLAVTGTSETPVALSAINAARWLVLPKGVSRLRVASK